MHGFKDTAGRTWELVLNIAQVRRVKALTDIDLYTIVDDGLKPLADLLSDPCKMVDLLYVICKDEAEKRNLSDEDFGRSFDGDVLEAASLAFVETLTDFFPKQRREALRKIMTKGKRAGAILLASATEKLDALDPDKMASELLASLTKPPASSESTPDRSPSAS